MPEKRLTIEGIVENINPDNFTLAVRSYDGKLYELWVLSEFTGGRLITVLPAQVGNRIKVTCYPDIEGDLVIDTCEGGTPYA